MASELPGLTTDREVKTVSCVLHCCCIVVVVVVAVVVVVVVVVAVVVFILWGTLVWGGSGLHL